MLVLQSVLYLTGTATQFYAQLEGNSAAEEDSHVNITITKIKTKLDKEITNNNDDESDFK